MHTCMHLDGTVKGVSTLTVPPSTFTLTTVYWVRGFEDTIRQYLHFTKEYCYVLDTVRTFSDKVSIRSRETIIHNSLECLTQVNSTYPRVL